MTQLLLAMRTDKLPYRCDLMISYSHCRRSGVDMAHTLALAC